MGGRRFKTSIDNMISQIFKGQQKCVYVYSIGTFKMTFFADITYQISVIEAHLRLVG